jgi:hypothetical protein
MTWNKYAIKGTLWDRKTKKIHPDNQKIKNRLRQLDITQAEAARMLGIPVSRLRKQLNSWFPMPEYLRQDLEGIIGINESVENAKLRPWLQKRLLSRKQQEE